MTDPGHTNDPLGFTADEDLQLVTLLAGWRFYERSIGREDAQQALENFIDAMRVVLELGVDPSILLSFKDHLTTALNAATDENLQRYIRDLITTINPNSIEEGDSREPR